MNLTSDHRKVLTDLLSCCLSWEPQACVMGNVTAGDAAEALAEVLGIGSAAPAPESPYTAAEKARAWDALCDHVRSYEVESARAYRLDEMAKVLASTRTRGVALPDGAKR